MDPQCFYPFHILILNSTVRPLCLWCCDLSAKMSSSSRTVPQEQLPSADLHPRPMPVVNLGHLSLDSTARSGVINDIAKACRDLGYFQVCFSTKDRAVSFFFSFLSLFFLFLDNYFRFFFLSGCLALPRVTSANSLPRKLICQRKQETDTSNHILVDIPCEPSALWPRVFITAELLTPIVSHC